MSIKINSDKCTGCGKCGTVCPGGLICKNEQGKAFVKYPRDCWGCTACIKECDAGAVMYYLEADIGGTGACMYTTTQGDVLKWIIKKTDNSEVVITTNRKEANKY